MRFVTYKEYAEEFNFAKMLDDAYDPCDNCCLDFNTEDCHSFDCEGGLFVGPTYLPEDENYEEEPLVAAMQDYEPVALKQLKGALGDQVGGNHYKDMAIQPTEYCQKNKLNTCESNIIKYASRHMNKGGIEDVKKIIHYARLLAKLDYGEEL